MKTGRVLLSCALALVCTAGSAAAQTKAEAACRDAIARNVSRFRSVVFKDIVSCHQRRSAGDHPISTNCNDVFTLPGNKATSAYQKAYDGIIAACPDTLVNVRAEYARCPSPHATIDDEGTSGIDDFDEAATCLLNLVATTANGAAATILGAPPAPLDAGPAKCQKALGSVLRKHTNAIAKTRKKCQAAADAANSGLSYACGTFDDGKIAASLAKMNELVLKSCSLSQDELATIGGCGQSPQQLIFCANIKISSLLGGGIIASAYELPNSCKLGRVGLFIRAGHGVQQTATRLDIGYSGFGHGSDLMDGFEGAGDLACDADCQNCAVTIAPVKTRPNSFCRCDSDPTIHCDTVNGADADDCSGGQCSCMFGPPLALSADGVPTCIVNELVAELDGIANAGTGLSTTTLENTSIVHLGISQVRPCPTCENDPQPNDGIRGGTCAGGARDTMSCDENGESPDFGPVSYECPPTTASNISGSGLALEFALTSVDAPSIGTDLLDGSTPVFCLQCSGDTTVGCSSDADCDALGIGTCSVNTATQAKANSCDDNICSAASPAQPGVCLANDADSWCDGLVRDNGFGILPCTSNADCSAFNSICPGNDCGDCSLLQLRSCFTDPFHASGTHATPGSVESSGVYGVDMVSTLCVPATANSSVNLAAGLPGPGRLTINFDFEGRCGSDPLRAYELPGGSNCP